MAVYRDRVRACPACRSGMRKLALASARAGEAVDVCDDCGGVYLEFFDGEPAQLSREIREHLRGFAAPAPPAGAAPTCPDCGQQMPLAPYLDEEGPAVARCNRCMAVFATPTQIRELADYHPPDDEPAEPSWFERLVGLLRG